MIDTQASLASTQISIGSRALAIACAVAWLPAGSFAHAPAEAGFDTAPLRVVRVAHAQPAGLRQWLVASLGGCAAKLGMPAPALPPRLTDAVLSQFMVRRQEEFFSGPHWAIYDTERTIGADVRNGCQLMVFTRRRAETGYQCRERQGWGNPALGAMMDLDHPVEGSVTAVGPDKHHGCNSMGPGIDPTGLPKDQSSSVECVWRGDSLSKRVEALKAKYGKGGTQPASSQAGGFDTCLYAKTPEYRNVGGRRAVIVKHRAPALVGKTGVTFHATEENALELESLTQGDPIAPDRFSAAALQAFVGQPTRTPLGD